MILLYELYINSNKHEFQVADSEKWAELIIHSGRSYNRGVHITDSSKTKQVEEIESRIQNLLSEYEKRRQPFVDTNMRPLQNSLTTTDYPYQPFVSIAVVQKQPLPNKHRVRGRLLAIKPTNVNDMVIKLCNNCDHIFLRNSHRNITCPNCPESELVLRYFFELLVEDDSGLIEVEVFGSEAEYFLNNISPEMLLNDDALMENIEMKFEKVLDTDNDARDLEKVCSLPWIELCLMSFTGVLGNDYKTYRVFGTSLI